MGIISKAESLRILEGTLREQALKKCAAQLATANAEEKRKIVLQINKEIRRELRNHMEDIDCGIH